MQALPRASDKNLSECELLGMTAVSGVYSRVPCLRLTEILKNAVPLLQKCNFKKLPILSIPPHSEILKFENHSKIVTTQLQ